MTTMALAVASWEIGSGEGEKTMKWALKLLIGLAVVLMLALLGSASWFAYDRFARGSGSEPFAPRPAADLRPAGAISLLDAQSEVVKAAETVMPAVVSVETKQKYTIPGFQHPFMNDPFFRRFFGDRLPSQPDREGVSQGLGSGVIVDSSGLVITNHHVIDGADEIVVKLANGKEFPATVLGSDQRIDIAVLKITGSAPFPVAPLGNSDEMKVGMFVLAFGTPFNPNLSQTVTMGIVSALGRSGLGIEQVENFIQTDAAINRGNSGGPLVNLNGEVVGINVAIATNGDQGNAGIGFAIPINSARHSLQSIVAHGRVIRGYLGVSIQNLNDELMQSLGLESTRGALVTEVVEGSPAEKSGLRAGDVILKWNGSDVASASGLTDAVGRTAVGARAVLTMVRDGATKEIEVTVAERPDETGDRIGGSVDPRGSSVEKLGLSVKYVEGEEAKEKGLPASGCLLVTGVKDGSLAEELGIEEGAGILQVDGQAVKTAEELKRLLGREGRHRILLRQNGSNRFIAFSL